MAHEIIISLNTSEVPNQRRNFHFVCKSPPRTEERCNDEDDVIADDDDDSDDEDEAAVGL